MADELQYVRAVVLVEGISDRDALEALAARRGRSLEGVEIVTIGGAHAIGRFLTRYAGVKLAGLCDANEAPVFGRGLERAGLTGDATREEMERLGFYVCEPDLEAELVRAVGPERVAEVIASEGELRSFRTFQKQPAKRGRPLEAQLHGFMWNRKQRYARLLVEACVDLGRVPRPLDAVLAHVSAA